MIFDVDEAQFAQRVVERSRELPVVVDFWAAWCGPCRALTPALEQAARSREGEVDLAKVDVDSNQGLAASFQVQGIPAVKGFRDGHVADEFTGALPPAEVERFFDRLVPSEADRLAESSDEAELRRALELAPRQQRAGQALGRLLLRRDEPQEALAVLEPFGHDFAAAGLAARARLSLNGHEVSQAFTAWDEGDHASALEQLQQAFAAATEPEERDLVRQAMVAIFIELGADHELAREHRRRLASALY